MLSCERNRAFLVPRYAFSFILLTQRLIQFQHHCSSKEHFGFHILLPALQSCITLGDLEFGQKVAIPMNLNDVFAASSLITMFSRCGRMDLARRAFDRMPVRDVVAWNSLLHGYASNGHPDVAVDLFSTMTDRLKPDAGTLVAAIKACSSGVVSTNGSGSSKFFTRGTQIHCQARETGYVDNIFVANSIIDFYCKSGRLVEARSVFDTMPRRSASSWNTIVLGYAEQGTLSAAKVAVEIFHRCSAVDSRGFVAVIKACSTLVVLGREFEAMELGKLAEESGFYREKFVANSLVDFYAKCGCTASARRVFDAMVDRDVISWTSLVLGYADNDQGELAIDLFHRFESPNELTFVAALKACSKLSSRENAAVKVDALVETMRIVSRAWRFGYGANIMVANSSMDAYAKCGSLLDARLVFDRMEFRTTASWNTMMLGYVDHGEARLALELFSRFDDLGQADSRSLIAAFKACGSLRMMDQGTALHSRAKELGLDSDSFVASALVEMYIRCSGEVAEKPRKGDKSHKVGDAAFIHARQVCDGLPPGEIVPWTSLMLGYVDSGQAEAALDVFASLRHRLAPDPQLFLAALSACGLAASLATSRSVHGDICRSGTESYSTVTNSLIDVYGKCGDPAAAHLVFDSSASSKDTTAWTALLAAYGRGGDSARVVGLFQKMADETVKPDSVTLLCLLSACSHAGLVDTGKRVFDSMLSEFGVEPGLEHYVCMTDLLCRANRTELAVEMVRSSMPRCGSTIVWKTILAACRKWNNVELGKLAFESLVEMDSGMGVAYVQMGNIYRG